MSPGRREDQCGAVSGGSDGECEGTERAAATAASAGVYSPGQSRLERRDQQSSTVLYSPLQAV